MLTVNGIAHSKIAIHIISPHWSLSVRFSHQQLDLCICNISAITHSMHSKFFHHNGYDTAFLKGKNEFFAYQLVKIPKMEPGFVHY